MKLNINKDKLLKHKFWILLVLAIPLILAGHFLLLGPVAAEIEKEQKGVIKTIADAAKLKGTYSDKNAEDKREQAKKLKAEEDNVWATLYGRQAGSMFWPKKIEDKYPIHDGKFLRELKAFDPASPPAEDKHTVVCKFLSGDDISITVESKIAKT